MIEIPVEDLNHQVKLISVCGDTIGLQDFHPKRTEIVQKQRQLCASLSLSRFFQRSHRSHPLPQPSDGGAIVLQPAANALPSTPAFAFGGSHEASEADLILRYNPVGITIIPSRVSSFNCGKGDGM